MVVIWPWSRQTVPVPDLLHQDQESRCLLHIHPCHTLPLTLLHYARHLLVVIPCLLLSFITLVIFWLPPESPAKMILGKVLALQTPSLPCCWLLKCFAIDHWLLFLCRDSTFHVHLTVRCDSNKFTPFRISENVSQQLRIINQNCKHLLYFLSTPV